MPRNNDFSPAAMSNPGSPLAIFVIEADLNYESSCSHVYMFFVDVGLNGLYLSIQNMFIRINPYLLDLILVKSSQPSDVDKLGNTSTNKLVHLSI